MPPGWVRGSRRRTNGSRRRRPACSSARRRASGSWTESEHRDGRTRFAILKGGSDHVVAGSEWYVDGGDVRPERSLKLLLVGGGLQRSPSIGFRLAVDRS